MVSLGPTEGLGSEVTLWALAVPLAQAPAALHQDTQLPLGLSHHVCKGVTEQVPQGLWGTGCCLRAPAYTPLSVQGTYCPLGYLVPIQPVQ